MNYYVVLLEAAESNTGFGVMCFCTTGWVHALPFVVYISEPHRRTRTLKTDRLLLVACKTNLLKKHRPLLFELWM